MAKTSTTKKQTSTKVTKGKTSGKSTGKVKSDSSDTGKRSFRAIYKTLDGDVIKKGRYCGQKPKQAACKALTAILNSYKEETGKVYTKVLNFGVVETTRGSRHKYYWYFGERRKVTTVEVVIKDRDSGPIIYRYNNSVMKASEEDCKDLLPGEDGYKTKSSKKSKKTKTSTKSSTKDKKSTKNKNKKNTKEKSETEEPKEKKNAKSKKGTVEKKSVKKPVKKITVEKKSVKKTSKVVKKGKKSAK